MTYFVAGEVLIRFKPGVADAARGAVRGASQAVLAERIHTGPMQQAGRGIMERVTLPQGRAVEVAIQALRDNPAVEYAEPNWIYTHEAVSADQSYTNGSLWGMYGDDSPAAGPAGTTNPYGSQAEKAWAAGSTGSKSVYVGIIDEGVDFNHPDLDANVWINTFDAADGVDNDLNGYVDDVNGWDFAGGNNTIYDGPGDDHGTHVAGTIAAEGTTTAADGSGVVGVDWNVTYIAGKFLGTTGGTTASRIKQSLLSGVRATASLSGKTATGGRLDVSGALNYVPPTPPTGTPDAPSTLVATATSYSQVALTWADKSTNEQGFRVERSTDGVTFTEVATTGPDATSYTATGLTSGTAYTLRVRAYNTAGNSAYSSPAQATTPGFTTRNIFKDDFINNTRMGAWQFKNGSWSQSGDVMRQTSTADAPEKKAMVTRQSETAVQITARVRVDSWRDGEYARAGVSLFVDEATGQGYNLIFTGRVPGTKRLEFLNDGFAWSGWDSQAGAAGSKAFNWTLGAWYQFKFRVEGGILSGKVWTDGTAEPADWTLTFDASRFPSTWGRTTGVAGLNGSAAGRLTAKQGRSYAAVSFDDVFVDAAGRAPSSMIAASSGTAAGSALDSTPEADSAAKSGGIEPLMVPDFTWPALEVNDDLASEFLLARRRRRTS